MIEKILKHNPHCMAWIWWYPLTCDRVLQSVYIFYMCDRQQKVYKHRAKSLTACPPSVVSLPSAVFYSHFEDQSKEYLCLERIENITLLLWYNKMTFKCVTGSNK